MTRISTVYELADYVHETLLGTNGVLTQQELDGSTVFPSAHTNNTQRLYTEGTLDGSRRVQQSLGKAAQSGTIFLTTTDARSPQPGERSMVQTRICPDTPFEEIEAVTDSLFMRELIRIANMRA